MDIFDAEAQILMDALRQWQQVTPETALRVLNKIMEPGFIFRTVRDSVTGDATAANIDAAIREAIKTEADTPQWHGGEDWHEW